MLETFEAKKPFYPLISFSVSVIVLIFGMLFSKNLLAFAFAFACSRRAETAFRFSGAVFL